MVLLLLVLYLETVFVPTFFIFMNKKLILKHFLVPKKIKCTNNFLIHRGFFSFVNLFLNSWTFSECVISFANYRPFLIYDIFLSSQTFFEYADSC